MNRFIAIAFLGLVMTPCSYAAHPASENDFHFAVSLGLTAGGDSIAKAEYTNGNTANIHGGGLIQTGIGLWYHKPSVPFSALLSINYHFDQANAKNGTIKFVRVPLEFRAFYHVNDSWRIGAGIRHTMSPTLTIDIDNQPTTEVDYRDTNSPEVEVAWGHANYWVGLRYVHETLNVNSIHIGYQSINDVNHSDDGSHLGLFANYAF